jgi:hypothetical protein
LSRRFAASLLVLFWGACGLFAAPPGPVLRLPGKPDRVLTAASVVGRGQMDVTIENVGGDSIVYHGLPLLEVLEKAGLETRTMAAGRKIAPAIVVATARDGYTVVFSVGELVMHRADPRVYLVSETAAGPLPENEGPVRLMVLGDRVRSAYALKTIELRSIGQNPAQEPKR